MVEVAGSFTLRVMNTIGALIHAKAGLQRVVSLCELAIRGFDVD